MTVKEPLLHQTNRAYDYEEMSLLTEEIKLRFAYLRILSDLVDLFWEPGGIYNQRSLAAFHNHRGRLIQCAPVHSYAALLDFKQSVFPQTPKEPPA